MKIHIVKNHWTSLKNELKEKWGQLIGKNELKKVTNVKVLRRKKTRIKRH